MRSDEYDHQLFGVLGNRISAAVKWLMPTATALRQTMPRASIRILIPPSREARHIHTLPESACARCSDLFDVDAPADDTGWMHSPHEMVALDCHFTTWQRAENEWSA